MKLRARLALVTVAVAIPQLGLLAAWDLQSRRAAAEQALAAMLPQMLEGGEGACVGAPRSWGGPQPPPDDPAWTRDRRPPPDQPHGAPPTLWAYGADGTPARSEAPALPADVAALAVGEVTRTPTPRLGSAVAVVTRTGWGEPCAFVAVTGSTVPGWMGAVLPATPIWLTPLFGVLVGVLLAAGSAVERIRRLTEAVRGVAARGYQEPVPVLGDDEVGELARAFDEAGHALQRQIRETERREQALRDFLANTSHDLLLPLTVLRGHLDALQRQSAEGEGSATLLQAMDEAHYLGAMVHNLAAAAQLDVGAQTLERAPVDLSALVERVAARHRPLARPRGIEVHAALPGEPAHTLGDVTLIEQAVNNLAYNAVRYNRPGGHVAIVLDVGGGRFTLRVLDDGPGVSPEQLHRLAERGFRGDEARSRAPEGQGLGLDIAHRVARVHGFELGFAPAEGGGLEVTLSGALAPERVPQGSPHTV
ncbi:MAG: HAMP domain-containing histidine kinase [Alphaproteobacteria bacterium]|nr:HAMP domain-containing histidine kinase [Alphaproteobacteria bacterium]